MAHRKPCCRRKQNYTAEQLLAVAGLKIGQVAGKSDFEAARDRLIATGPVRDRRIPLRT